MNKDLRQEIEKILFRAFMNDEEYLKTTDKILSLVYSHLEKKINDKRYKKTLGGYRQKGELGTATNSSWCEASNNMLSEIKQILKKELLK